MLQLSLAQLRTQAHRLVATGLAIIIAVGFVVATLVLNDTSKQTVFGALSSQYQNTDAVVTVDWTTSDEGPAAGDVTTISDDLAKLSGVAGVTVDRSAYLLMVATNGDGFRYAQVQNLSETEGLRWQKLAEGTWPTGAGQVVAAPGSGAELGSVVDLQLDPPTDENGEATGDGEMVRATVVGITDRASSINAMSQQQFWTTSSQATAWGATDLDAIRIEAAAGVSPDELADRVRTALDGTAAGSKLLVRTGEEESEETADSMVSGNTELTTVLLAFAALAVFVCALVIANTFAVLLAQRVRELALLRAIGAAGRQLRRGVLVESFVIGLTASALGVAAGIGLAAGVSALAAHLDNSPVPLAGVSVHPMPIGVGLLVGTVVTMVAAFNPARKATKVAPLAAMRPMDAPPANTAGGLVRRIAGILVAVPGVAIAWVGGSDGSLLVAMAGGMLTFLAVLLLSRWLVPLAVAGVGRLIGPAGQVPGKLAALNATRNPQRTAATATALIIGVTLCTTMVVGAATTRASASALIDDSYPTDVVLTTGQATGSPATLAGTIAGVRNVTAAVSVIGSDRVRVGAEKDIYVLGVDPAQADGVVRSDQAGLVPEAGTVVVPEWYAQEWKAEEGEPVTLTVGGRSVELTAHVVQDQVDTPRMAASDLAALDPKVTIQQIWVQLSDDLGNDDRADTLDAVSTAAAEVDPGVTLSGAANERAAYDQMIDILLMIVLGLLAVAVVIAVIGVGNTMALSVLERRRESGVLRALGLTRGQLRWMLLWEAMLIAGVAAAIGVTLGSVYGVFGVKAAMGTSGSDVSISIPPAQLLLILLVATLAGALSSVLPSRRAARISPVAAIASA